MPIWLGPYETAGWLAQSMAFFSPPGIERLYSEQHRINGRDGVFESRGDRMIGIIVV